jgi:hypothetical protein
MNRGRRAAELDPEVPGQAAFVPVELVDPDLLRQLPALPDGLLSGRIDDRSV